MARTGDFETVAVPAAGDLSVHHLNFVGWRASGQVGVSSLATSTISGTLGVLMNKPSAAGRAATVAVRGQTKVRAGAAVIQGDFISNNTSGRATAATSGDLVFGTALTAAAADGDIMEVNLGTPWRLTM